MTVSATRRAPGTLPLAARLNLAVLAVLVLALTAILWPHWRDNPDLSHGYFMLPVFLYLLLESRSGSARWLPARRWTMAATGGLLALGLLALAASGLYAAALGWSHALVAYTLTIGLVFTLGAGLVVFSADDVRLVPLNWSSVVAVGLWLLSAPIPPGSYTRLTLGLQLAVSEATLRALHLLGIAAIRHGNIIDLATATVGVEEACSGVRSLISCIFAGFVFSATLVRRPWARVLIVGLAAPLAVAMNFVRSLTLTLLANSGVNIAGTWHDVTGFAVLGVTAVLLGGLALLLERRESAKKSAASADTAPASSDSPPRPERSPLQLLLATALSLSAVVIALFAYNTRPAVRAGTPVPDLLALLPAKVPGWEVQTSKDLYQFSSTLKTDHLAQRTYLHQTPAGLEQITIYLAYWRAGQAPVSLVASHTPDACWPGSGWTLESHTPSSEYLTVDGRSLAPAESRLFKAGDYPQYVWFWHLYDGRPIPFRDPYSASALLKIALRYGFRHEGDQLFVRVSSNRPWPTFSHEALLEEVFARLKPLGL